MKAIGFRHYKRERENVCMCITSIVTMTGRNKYSRYYQIDNSIDCGEKRKFCSELSYTYEEVCT
jgi:hypothetical protein